VILHRRGVLVFGERRQFFRNAENGQAQTNREGKPGFTHCGEGGQAQLEAAIEAALQD